MIDIARELDGVHREIAELRQRVARLEAINQNVVRVKILTVEQLVEQMKRRHGRNGSNTTRTPLPDWGTDAQSE